MDTEGLAGGVAVGSVATAAWRGRREILRLLGVQSLALPWKDVVGGWRGRYCPRWGRRGSWNFSPLQGQEKGRWRCLSITYWGMFSKGKGWDFLFGYGKGGVIIWVFFFFVCFIWVCQDPVSKAPGAELFFLFRVAGGLKGGGRMGWDTLPVRSSISWKSI